MIAASAKLAAHVFDLTSFLTKKKSLHVSNITLLSVLVSDKQEAYLRPFPPLPFFKRW